MGFPHSSAGKESACNAGDPSSIPGLERSVGEGIGLPTPVFLGFSCGSAGKESACKAGDLGLIPGLGRSSGEGKGYPLQYSSLENSDMTERLSLALHFSENLIYREQHMLPRASHFQVIFNQQNLFVEERN